MLRTSRRSGAPPFGRPAWGYTGTSMRIDRDRTCWRDKASWHSFTSAARRKNLAGGIDVGSMVINCNVWLDAPLMGQPAEHLGRAIAAIAEEAARIESEPFERTLNHAPGASFGCRITWSPRHRRYCVVDIDQVVRGVRRWFGRSALRSKGDTNFGVTSVAAPKAASSRQPDTNRLRGRQRLAEVPCRLRFHSADSHQPWPGSPERIQLEAERTS